MGSQNKYRREAQGHTRKSSRKEWADKQPPPDNRRTKDKGSRYNALEDLDDEDLDAYTYLCDK